MKKSLLILLIGSIFVAWLTVIFIFSDMVTEESNGKSKKIVEITITKVVKITNKLNITNIELTDANVKKLVNEANYPFRKCMHAAEYFVLAILILLICSLFPKLNILRYFIATFLCFIYACTDEYHQQFVSGRTSQFSDCLVDTTGAIIGCLIFAFIVLIIKYEKSKNKSQ